MQTSIRRGHALAATVALSAALLGAASASGAPHAQSAGVHDCSVYAYYPNVMISSVRNMRCSTAKRDMRRYKKPIYRRFTTPGGFRCTRVSGNSLGGQWRCVRGAKAYRFEFGD